MDISVIIPARDEPYLQKTIDDLLAKSGPGVEVVAVLDGYWPAPIIKDDKRVTLIHRGSPKGMRQAINSAARIAKGKYLLKCDAHCIFANGWDDVLKRDCGETSALVPVRYLLDPEKWQRIDGPKYEFQFIRSSDFKGKDWKGYADRVEGQQLPELMTTQGSCWFMPKSLFERIGGLDEANYGAMGKEAQEIGLKVWLSGGQLLLDRHTWYAHWNKDRGLYRDMKAEKEKSAAFCKEFWMNNRWPLQTRKFEWLIERFNPVPTW